MEITNNEIGMLATSLIIHIKRALQLALQGDVWFPQQTVVLKCTYGYFKVMLFLSQGSEQDCNMAVTVN